MNSFSKTLDTCPFLFRRHKFVKPLLALSLCGPIQEIEFNDGARLYGDIREPFPRSYFLTKFYNTEYCALARAFMAKGGHYFDIGANYGFCSFGILGDGTLLKDAELHLFEANPAMAELLQRSAKMFYPRHSIHIENAAVCNRNGESGFFLKNGHLGGSYLSAEGKLKVRNVTLDGYFEFNKIHEAVFMKMDIEGAESLALDGGKKIFSEGRVRALYIEVAAETLKKFNTAPDQLINKIYCRSTYELHSCANNH